MVGLHLGMAKTAGMINPFLCKTTMNTRAHLEHLQYNPKEQHSFQLIIHSSNTLRNNPLILPKTYRIN
eukprot:c17422_g1_i2 orf=210-413(+)